MEYKRLTDRDITKVCFDTWELCGLDDVCKRDCRNPEPCKIPQIIHRLAKLEDEIEAGTLIEIPGIRKLNIAGMDCVEAVYIQRNGTIGECVCLNEAEAEKMLEEIRNETKSIDSSGK